MTTQTAELGLVNGFTTDQYEALLGDPEPRVRELGAFFWGPFRDEILRSSAAGRSTKPFMSGRMSHRMSHGRYLSFLGVDEAILPQTLDTLAGELDSDRSLDWDKPGSGLDNTRITSNRRPSDWFYDP